MKAGTHIIYKNSQGNECYGVVVETFLENGSTGYLVEKTADGLITTVYPLEITLIELSHDKEND